MPTYRELLSLGIKELSGTSSSPELDSGLLLAFASGLSRVHLISSGKEEVAASSAQRFDAFLSRRKLREPVAYITGSKEFWGLELEVNPDVLIPRPETEILVEKGLEVLAARKAKLRILDLGTGSGCLALALGVELQKAGRDFHILAVDFSRPALEVARKNAARHGLESKIEFLESHWFSNLAPQELPFDLMVANPPYIANADNDLSPETAYEPVQALYAGEEGTEVIAYLLKQFPPWLRSGGAFIFEAGASQRPAIEELFKRECQPHFSFSPLFDLAGSFRGAQIQTVNL
jgi:release factor glutamine methyltransferase